MQGNNHFVFYEINRKERKERKVTCYALCVPCGYIYSYPFTAPN